MPQRVFRAETEPKIAFSAGGNRAPVINNWLDRDAPGRSPDAVAAAWWFTMRTFLPLDRLSDDFRALSEKRSTRLAISHPRFSWKPATRNILKEKVFLFASLSPLLVLIQRLVLGWKIF